MSRQRQYELSTLGSPDRRRIFAAFARGQEVRELTRLLVREMRRERFLDGVFVRMADGSFVARVLFSEGILPRIALSQETTMTANLRMVSCPPRTPRACE